MSKKLLASVVIVLASAMTLFYVNDMISSAKEVRVSLAGAELREASLERAKMDFLLNVTNPTRYQYEVELIEYDIYLQGVRIGNGSIKRLELTPKSSTIKHALTEIRYSELSIALLSSLMSGRFEINVTGYARVKALIFPVDLRFSEVRTFP